MKASRAQPPTLALLASAALFSFPAAAQPGPALASEAEREIAIGGEADEPLAVVYGAPELPLVVSFDAPVRKDTAVTVEGADVRPHPFRQDALFITPSRALAAQRSVRVAVPLSDGVVELTVAYSPPKRDTSVRIVRRATSTAGPALTGGEQKELLRLAAERAFEPGTCAGAGTTPLPRQVERGEDARSPGEPRVCGGGAFAYMSVKVLRTECTPATARLTRGDESTEVLLLARTAAPCGLGTCWLIVARAPPGDGGGFTLELLAQDGAVCQSHVVNLKPNPH